MRAPPWYKRCPADWQKGTRRFAMSFELRGFYSECLDAQWELQGQLPKDAKQLAMMLGTNARMVRALMPKLIALGKIIETETGYYNPRMMSDILGSEDALAAPEFKPLTISNQPPIEREPISNRARTDLQSSAKIPKNPTNTTRDLETDTEIEINTPLPPKGGPTQLDALKAFEAYNATALRCGLQQAGKLTPDRSRKIIARLREYGNDGWQRALANVERSGFLTGKNDKGWRANLDFLLQASSFGKVHDGTYGNGRHAAIDRANMVYMPSRYGAGKWVPKEAVS